MANKNKNKKKPSGGCYIDTKKNLTLSVEAGTERTVYAKWIFSGSKRKYTDHCLYQWRYKTSAGQWIMGEESGTVNKKTIQKDGEDVWTTTFTYPENAVTVAFRVKPVAETYTVTKKDKNGKKKKVEKKRYSVGWQDYVPLDSTAFEKKQAKLSCSKIDFHYDPAQAAQYGLWARLYPLYERGKTTIDDDDWYYKDGKKDRRQIYDYLSGWSIEWTFWNGNYWFGGYSQDYSKETRELEFVGIVPENAKQVKLIVKPTTETNGVVVQTKEERLYFTPTRRKPTGVVIGTIQNANRELMATWTIAQKARIEQFTYEWQIYINSTWQSSSTGSVDYESVGSNNTWASSAFTIPENASKVRFRVKAVGLEGSGYAEDWSDYTEYDYKVQSLSVTDSKLKGSIKVELESNTSRKLIATVKYESKNAVSLFNVQSYETQWQYVLKFPGSSSRVYTDSVGTASTDGAIVSTFTPSSEYVTDVLFRIRPIPEYSNNFVGTWSEWVTFVYPAVPKRSVKNLKLAVADVQTDKKLYASWSIDKTDHLANYEVQWEYLFKNRTLGDIWVIDRNETTTQAFSNYDVPATANEVRLTVRPICDNDMTFVGEWCKYVSYLYDIKPATVKLQDIKREAGTDRGLYVTWTVAASVKSHTGSYTVYYEHYRSGLWTDPTTAEVSGSDILNFFFTPNDNADQIRLRVRPNEETGNNLYYVGEYSDYRYYEYSKEARGVKDITVQLQRGANRTVVATWGIDNPDQVAGYNYKWRYSIDDVWFDGNESTASAETPACTYDVPALANVVEIKVAPIPQYSDSFIPDESEYVIFLMPDEFTPAVPDVPNVSITGFTIEAIVDTYDENTSHIDFEVTTEEETYTMGGADVIQNRATASFTVDGGHTYRVRARGVNEDGDISEWSNWSNDLYTIPDAVEEINEIYATSENSVVITWEPVEGAQTYTIEYAKKERYFDVSPDQVSQKTGYTTSAAEIAELELGIEWFFRIRAVNPHGESEWSEVVSVVLGVIPYAPTTWSSTTVGTIDSDIYLYWIHNADDGSYERAAELELTINGKTRTITLEKSDEDRGATSYYLLGPNDPHRVINYLSNATWTESSGTYTSNDDISVNAGDTFRLTVDSEKIASVELREFTEDGTSSARTFTPTEAGTNIFDGTYAGTTARIQVIVNVNEGGSYSDISLEHINYSLNNGAKVTWRVRTKGVMPDYGEWSTQRAVDIYVPPTVSIALSESINWEWDPFNFDKEQIYEASGPMTALPDGTLTGFPLLVKINSTPVEQTPVVYVVTLISNDAYISEDEFGNDKQINEGDELFRRYYYTDKHEFVSVIDVSDVTLESDVSYTAKVAVSMDSGLSAETTEDFVVALDDEDVELDAEITYDPIHYTMFIRPYSDHEDGSLVENILLSVYRINFDGSFTAIGENLSNVTRPTVTDPHPSLDYARYRIVGRFTNTGKAMYYDLPGEEILETSIIIQWNERWKDYSSNVIDEELPDSLWTGTLLELPYNVDESDSNEMDVELVEYIGRKHPVSYYGTQVGQTTNWSTDIPKSDKATLALLRRLAIWPGDAYVRSPSGTGYWAHVEVSYDISHNTVITPVSLKITRVEGGI